jgi:hypothetical protein
MSFSKQPKARKRSRKAFAFFSETGKATTEKLYIHIPKEIQTEGTHPRSPIRGLVLYKFSGLS